MPTKCSLDKKSSKQLLGEITPGWFELKSLEKVNKVWGEKWSNTLMQPQLIFFEEEVNKRALANLDHRIISKRVYISHNDEKSVIKRIWNRERRFYDKITSIKNYQETSIECIKLKKENKKWYLYARNFLDLKKEYAVLKIILDHYYGVESLLTISINYNIKTAETYQNSRYHPIYSFIGEGILKRKSGLELM